jgi:hypothetical protein
MTPPFRGKRARRCGLPHVALLLASMTLACGGSSPSSGSSSGPAVPSPAPTPILNTVPVTVDGGPVPDENIPNLLYAQVKVCVPGTSECQTIGGVQVDTGSSGLRLLSSALTLSLPRSSGSGGHPLAECVQYVTSSTWGSVRTADVQLGGEIGHAIPIQVIGDPATPNVPSDCTSGGFPTNDTQKGLGANGILGVGNYVEDCGEACNQSGASNPGQYYECPSPSGCRVTTVGLTRQVANPVAFFGSNSNGVVITLPSVSEVAPTLTGSMTFGIGTQTNNALGPAKVFRFDRDGNLTTRWNGASLPYSFLDTGSDFLFFPDKKIPTCTDYQNLFCPKEPLTLSATIMGANGSSEVIPFGVGNADTLFRMNDSAFATVCGPNLVGGANDAVGPNSFDWGLPFYFGRTVFTSIEGRSTPAGVGPFVAF